MRILLLGRNGQVGWELERLLAPQNELTALGRAELDLADVPRLAATVRTLQPEVIVNAAAYTAVDKAESERDAAFAANATAPRVLAEEAKRIGALLVHYSTDYVFDGEKQAPYVEDDPTRPINVYGESKLAGERAIQASGCRYLVLRASWVYGPRGRNFFLTMARKAAAGEPLRVVDDQIGTPTTSAFLAQASAAILSRCGNRRGVYHLAPKGATSWCGFARAIVGRIGASVQVNAIRAADYPTAARRPAYSVLDSRRAELELGIVPPSWEELLDSCTAQYLSQARK